MKSNFSKEEINSFLNQKYKEKIEIIPVKEGQESQVYWYIHDHKKYIIRINATEKGFRKDLYGFLHFNSDRVPVPPVLETGEYDNAHFYCISAKAEGGTYQDSSEETIVKLLPDITDILLAIAETDISGTAGYGVFDGETGNAPFDSWKKYLLNILDNEKFNWKEIKKKDFIDAFLIDEIAEKFENIVPFCPEIRKLLHGDFGSNNLLVDDNTLKFSGVIDWDCAAYGDPLYDVAISYFWSTWLMCMNKTSAYWETRFQNTPDYRRRILCYELHIGLNEIYENASENEMESALWIQERCREILVELCACL